MNILFLNSLGKMKWGGGEKWMISAGYGLKKRGHTVTIACKKGSIIEQRSIDKGLNVFHYSIPADIAFWKGPQLKSYLKKESIDVLICCQNKDVKVGAKAAKEVGLKAIFARQGIQNLQNKKKYIRPFTEYIDGIITNTTSIKAKYESFGWFPENFIHVIYNGVDIPDNIAHLDLHKMLNLPPESKTVLSAGRLNYQKGFDQLIDVAIRAKEENLNWHFIIAGEGKLKNELKNTAKRNGVDDAIHFIGFSSQIPSLLKSADVFVLPSRYEGMPNALLEAMAMGKASVATSVNGVSELVEDGVSGFLVPSNDADQLFSKLNQLLSNESLRGEIEKNALQHVKENFTMEEMTKHLEKLFIQFLQSKQ